MAKGKLVNVRVETIKDEKTKAESKFVVSDVLICDEVTEKGFYKKPAVISCWDAVDVYEENNKDKKVAFLSNVEYDCVPVKKIVNNKEFYQTKFKNCRSV
jgi:hypothetical protein